MKSTARKRYYHMVFVVLLSVSLLCLGCTPAEEPIEGEQPDTESPVEEVAGEPIKIGMIQPITGPIAASGTALRDGARIYAEYINDQGGINGRPIDLIVEDSANDPAMAASAFNKLISRDKVLAVIGAWGSSPTLAVVPLAKQNEIPLVVDTASNYKVTDKNEEGSPWIFRVTAPTIMESRVLSAILIDDLGLKNPYILSVNNDWGRGTADVFTAYYEGEGYPVGGVDYLDQAETNYQVNLTKILSSGADSIILTADAAQAALVVEQASGLGLDLPILAPGLSCSMYKITKLAGMEAAEGFMQTAAYIGSVDPMMTADPEGARYFNETWEAKGYDVIEIQEAAKGWDSLMVLCEAMKTIDSDKISSASIRDALENVEAPGICFGNIKFEEWENFIFQNVPPVSVVGVIDGKYSVILEPTKPIPEN